MMYIHPPLFVAVLVSLLLAREAQTCGPGSPPRVVKDLIGWSADGRYLAFEYVGTIGYGHIGEGEVTGEFIGVFDTLTERSTDYVLNVQVEAEPEDEADLQELKRWRKLPTRVAFDHWRGAHPLTQTTRVMTCGEAKLEVHLDDIAGYPDLRPAGSWNGSVFTYKADPVAALTIGVEKGGRFWRHAELFQRTAQWTGDYAIEVSWSPTCLHVAWVVSSKSIDAAIASDGLDGGYFSDEVNSSLLVKPAGPAVHVMGHKTATDAAAKVVEAFARAGVPAHRGATALKERDQSVVFAWKGVRDEAEEIAALVPGGASLQPLTWATDADIVVAAGASAAR
jgi:hypothetical protein